MKRFNPAIQILLLLVCAGQTQAQNGDAVLVDIAPCMKLQTSPERHGCYDSLEAAARAALQQAESGIAQAVQPSAVVPAVQEPIISESSASEPEELATVDDFGEVPPAAARIVANGEGEQELHDRIAALDEREPGRWLITLESGQVWYQTNSSRIRLTRGMGVRIYPSPLGGSFRLAGTDGASTGFVQVTRVQ